MLKHVICHNLSLTDAFPQLTHAIYEYLEFCLTDSIFPDESTYKVVIIKSLIRTQIVKDVNKKRT